MMKPILLGFLDAIASPDLGYESEPVHKFE